MSEAMIIILMTRLAANILLTYREDADFKREIERKISEMGDMTMYLLPRCFDEMAEKLLAVLKSCEYFDH